MGFFVRIQAYADCVDHQDRMDLLADIARLVEYLEQEKWNFGYRDGFEDGWAQAKTGGCFDTKES